MLGGCIIARAHDLQERVLQDNDLTLHAIASQEHVTPGYISRLLRLPSLAPDIIAAIVNGKNPPQLTAKKLMRAACSCPLFHGPGSALPRELAPLWGRNRGHDEPTHCLPALAVTPRGRCDRS